MNKINWNNAIIGGVIGTFAFDIFGFFFTATWWEIPWLLIEKTSFGVAYGVFSQFLIGVLLAIIYAGIAPSLWGSTWFKSLFFVTAETIALVWFFMFPLLGACISGTRMAEFIPLISLVRHMAYGAPVW